MMETHIKLNLEDEVREFVGDFNKFFEELKVWIEDAVQIKTWREFYEKSIRDSSESEMDIDFDTTMETKPTIDREEKLQKVREKLSSERTNERLTDYDGVMSDKNLSLPQKIIHLQKAIGNATRRKILFTSLQGELLEKCFRKSKKVYKETLVETKITRWQMQFLQKLYKLTLDYNQIKYCTVPLSYIHSNFKIIEEICKHDKERWK